MVKLPKTPSFRLDGRRALVTGGGRGIGLAAAAGLAEAGAHILLAARTMAEITEAASAIKAAGGSAEAVQLDVTDLSAVERAVSGTGPFDILVNNAGINRPRPMIEMSAKDFDAVMEVNVRAAYFVAQAVARGMAGAGRGGSIINISSQMGHVGGPNRTVYCASKHAMEGMTKAMAFELGPRGIRVNTICPTFVETPLSQSSLAQPQFREWVMSKIKLGRLAQLEDIMAALVFLAGDGAAMITGSALMIDGGWTAG